MKNNMFFIKIIFMTIVLTTSLVQAVDPLPRESYPEDCYGCAYDKKTKTLKCDSCAYGKSGRGRKRPKRNNLKATCESERFKNVDGYIKCAE